MSMSDCPKCWDTPCTCGHLYRTWTVDALAAHIHMLKGVLTDKVLETCRTCGRLLRGKYTKCRPECPPSTVPE